MCDKVWVLVLTGLGLVYNYLTPGPPPISPEVIYTGAFAYLTGSAIGFARGSNGNSNGKPAA